MRRRQMTQLNEIQRAARRLPGHWYKGDASDGNGNFCGIGHLLEVMGLPLIEPNSEELSAKSLRVRRMIACLNQAAEDKFPERASDEFAGFNDHEDTTEADVVAVMELAGERWAVEHDQCV
jgi:hypothetical protein